jgi:hypothetical protein
MPFITDDPIVTPAGQPFVTEDPLVPQSPEDLAAAWESGQLTDEALTPAQALQLTLEKAKTRQSPTALVRGGLAGTGQLLSQGLETAKELGSYGLKNPPSVAGFGLTKAAAEGALRGSADLGQIGKNVLEGAVFNPYEIVSKAAEKRGWPTALMQAARVMQPSMEVGTPMEKLAKVFPMETAEVARKSMISDRQTAAQRQQLTENKRSLLEELTTAGMADPMGMLPFGERLPDSVRFGASPATAESLGRVMAPAAELGNLTETVGMVADPTMLAAPGASLAAKLGARIAPRMAARLGAREAAGQARQALLEGFEQAAQAAPPSRARFVGGPDLSVRDVGPVPPPVIQPRFTAGPDGTVSFTAPPVIPTAPDLAPLLDAYTGSVRQAAGAPRGMAQAAVGRAGRIAEQVGGAVSRAAESMGDLADRYRTALGIISAAAGAVKGPLGVLAGSQVPKVVSTAAKWAKEASRAGAALRTIAATDWKSSVPVWRQIAKDPSAPQWLVRGVTAPVVGRLTVGKLAETAIRGGGRIAAGAAEGAATDALFAAADPEMGGEQIGGEAGPGGLIGFLSTSATARGAARQQKADAVAYDAMRIAARSIDAGANPLVVARASDRLMQTAAVMETLFRGSLTGQRGIKVDLMDAGQFAQVAGSPAEAAFFDPQTGRVAVNLETIDADGRQLHEVSHALMQSAAASNPAIVEHFRGLLGPDGLARARQDYQQALGRQIPQDDAYIVGELFAESVANTLRGVDLSEGVPAAIGDTRAVSFFRDADVRKALRDASTQELVRQQVDALTSFRPAVDLEREPGVRLDPAMAGKHPAFPVEPQANGTTGNDFVQQTPDGRTVATPPAQVRTRVRNRRREVLELFPDTEPIPDSGPTAPPVPEVAVRRTPAGLVQKTGTRLGDRFYATAQTFGEATKNMLRRVEEAITNGETLSGWYQQVGQSDNWAASVRESLGAIEAQFKDFIPYAFKVDKQGNLLVENYSLTALERKANQWAARQGPLSLELWNGDIAAFRQDVQTYLNNHSEGRPGADGIGDGKRNLINVFLVGGNRTFEALNPLRAQARGKDRQGIVRSYRADRLQTVEPSEVQGFTQPNYGKQVRNMSPKADKAFWEADARQFSPQVRGEPVAFTPPQKTVKAYKLFRTLKSRPGELFPLFIGKNESVPVGEWMPAKFIPTKGFAERPGWHAGVLPNAPHLLSKDGTMAPDRVWAEVEIPADADWQSRADATPTGDIKSEVPAGGYYTFKRPGLQGGSWIIGGALKVNRILSQPEVDKIMSEAGANKAAPVSGDVRRSSAQIDTPALDENYLAAVDRGNLKEIQKLVDQAADRNGYNVGTVWHGTGGKAISQFTGTSWFSSKRGLLARYGGEQGVVSAKIRLRNPLDLTKDKRFDMDEAIDAVDVYKAAGLPESPSAKYRYGRPAYQTVNSPEFIEAAKMKGYDGIKVRENGTTTYAVFDPSDVKSADPITYDDAGNVVPLSQRFGASPDIRYSAQINEGADAAPGEFTRNAPLKKRSAIQIRNAQHAQKLWDEGYTLYGAAYDNFETEAPERLKSAEDIERFDPENLVAMPPVASTKSRKLSPRIEQSVLDLDKLGNKDLPQVNAKTIPYPANPTYPTSIALPARWGLVNRNIVGMPRSQAEVRGIVDRQVERLAKVVEENPTFAKESARFYLDMAESSMLMADSAFPESYGKEKWRAAELMLRFLALGSPRTGVSANATKSSYSASAAASNFTAGFKVGFGSQQTGAKNTFSAWKKGLPFDMSGEGVDNKVRNFYMNGLAELLDLARNEGDPEAIDYLMDSAAAGLELTKPGEKVASEKHPEVQRLLDGMATVDMWDMAAKGYAWPGWISNKKVRPGEGKVPWVWTEEKYATKSTLKSPAWSRIAKELSQKKRVVRSPADLRYQEARALRIEGNRDWDATTWAERIKQPFDPDTELTTFSNVSEEGLSPGGAGPLYDAQQTIDGLIADEINSRGMAPLFGKEKLLARNAQEILWALERLDNPIEANNDLALFGNTFKGLANEINRLRTDEYGPVASRPKPDDRGSTVLAAMESAYAKLANQDMPLEVVSAGTSPEARTIQDTIQRLRDSGVQQPEIAATQAVADGLHEFLTEAADRHGVDVTVDSVSVGNGGYTENGAPSVNPNMVMRLRGSPTETRNLLEILSRALDQDGGNIFRRPTIRELNTPTTKFNTVVTFKTEGMTTEQKTAFFMDLNGLKDSDGNSFFTGFTETADGMAIGDQFYGGDMAAQVDAKRLEILRILRKHKVADFWADSVIIETVSRNSPEPEGLRQQPFAAEIMDEVQRRLKSAAGNAPTFPQMLDEPNRAVRRLETGKTKEFSGKTALTRYFVEARSAVDAAMLRGIMDEAMGEQLKETLTEVEKQREPEVKAQAAQKAKERADAKALEARRKARLKAMKERRKATE